jgi:hypothetical protein
MTPGSSCGSSLTDLSLARRSRRAGLFYAPRFASMSKAHEVRYWTEALRCSEDELAAAVARVGNSPDAVRREVCRHGHTGHSDATLLSDGDEATAQASITSSVCASSLRTQPSPPRAGAHIRAPRT